jgi:hypothetical protein
MGDDVGCVLARIFPAAAEPHFAGFVKSVASRRIGIIIAHHAQNGA